MKKLVLYACVGALALSFAACGSTDGNSGQSTEQSSVSTESTAPESSKPLESDGSAAGAPEDDFGSGDDGDEWDDGDAWEEETAWSEEMLALREAVKQELGEDNYWANMAISAEYLEGTYGVSADMYEDYLGEMPMMMTHVDTLIIIKAKDGQAEAVETALNAYRDSMVSNTSQYPMNIGKIQASQVERIGNYVCFVQLGADVMEVSENGDEAVIVHCREQNDRAIEAIAANVEQ